MHYVLGKINYGGLKHNSLYLGLVLLSGGWQSLIDAECRYAECRGAKQKCDNSYPATNLIPSGVLMV